MYRDKILFGLIPFALLTGCSVMNDSYDCPLQETASCVSLSEMDNRITYGMLRQGNQKENTLSDKLSANYVAPISEVYPKREPEMTTKIWFAPYTDHNGDYHEASYIYTVTRQASWSIAQKDNGMENRS
jgi:hypothetical protein